MYTPAQMNHTKEENEPLSGLSKIKSAGLKTHLYIVGIQGQTAAPSSSHEHHKTYPRITGMMPIVKISRNEQYIILVIFLNNIETM